MTLTSDQIILIQEEIMLGMEPTIKTKEALEFRAELKAEIEEMQSRSITVELPTEWADPGPIKPEDMDKADESKKQI